MTLLKKISSDWQPQEFPNAQVGETVDFPGPVGLLIREGHAVLVDEAGKELPAPGTVFTCAICFKQDEVLEEYLKHVVSHSSNPNALAEKPSVEVAKDVEEIKAKAKKKSNFAERMKVAREKKKAEKEKEQV